MAATLNVTVSFNLIAFSNTLSGCQGVQGNVPTNPLALSVTGLPFTDSVVLANNTKQLMWSSAANVPSTFSMAFCWADQNVVWQFIGSTTNFLIQATALFPYIQSGQSFLAAATTTPIGNSAPAFDTITSIYVGNYSGQSANCALKLAA